MNSAKADLRQQLKQARFELTDADYTVKSRAIIANLKTATDWSQVKALHYFEPLRHLFEPDISDFIVWLEDTYPDMHLATSRKIGSNWVVIGVRGDAPPQQFDVVIVPMLGFDASQHRIGFGGGYYDRFLATQPEAFKLGVCFELGRVGSLPVEPHDIALDSIVTE